VQRRYLPGPIITPWSTTSPALLAKMKKVMGDKLTNHLCPPRAHYSAEAEGRGQGDRSQAGCHHQPQSPTLLTLDRSAFYGKADAEQGGVVWRTP